MKYELASLDTIIFDLGEVIVDLDTKAVIDQFNILTDGRGQDLRELIIGSPYLFQYETGKMTDMAFVKAIGQLFESEISYEDFKYAWNLMIKGIPTRKLEMIQELKKSHQILVLSNTNAMHEECFEQMVTDQIGVTMRELVDKAYYSHDIERRKPNADIYEFIIADSRLTPEKALFLDDKMENIEAARSAGLNAEQVIHPDMVYEILGYE